MSNSTWDPTGSSPYTGSDEQPTQAVPAVGQTEPWPAVPGGSSGQPPYGNPAAGQQPAPQGSPATPPPPGPGYGTGAPYGTQPPYGGTAPMPQYGAPSPYGAPGYTAQQGPYQAGGFAPYYASATRDTGAATALLVVGIIMTVLCGNLPAIGGIVCGALALSGNKTQAEVDRLVKMGWIITVVGMVIMVLLVVLYFVFLGTMLSTTSSLALLPGGR